MEKLSDEWIGDHLCPYKREFGQKKKG